MWIAILAFRFLGMFWSIRFLGIGGGRMWNEGEGFVRKKGKKRELIVRMPNGTGVVDPKHENVMREKKRHDRREDFE